MLASPAYAPVFPVDISDLPAAAGAPTADTASTTPPTLPLHELPAARYIEIIDSCGPYFDGECVNLRSGPGEDYPVVLKLRSGIVLEVAETVNRNGRDWHKIQIDTAVKYPERISSAWYVAADLVRVFEDEGDMIFDPEIPIISAKNIVVDRSDQMLYAYDGDTLFMQVSISTGHELTPTPRGNFIVFKKTPSRYMQGPLPGVSDQFYDLPGVPWDLYFTHGGAVIHGAYWHDKFGEPWSHGCVNLPVDKAMELYYWAPLGTQVTVRD